MIRTAVVVTALLAALAGGLALWAYERDDDSAEAGTQEVRWFNISVAIPEGSGLVPIQRYWKDDRPVLIVGSQRDISEGIVIDATTGEVMLDKSAPDSRAALDEVRRSITVSSLDRSDAPWPYSGDPPSTVPEEWGMTSWGKVTFIPPDPASGITVVFSEGNAPEGPSNDIAFTNGESTLAINADTGAVYKQTTTIRPEDREAFDRLLATVRLTEPSR